MKVSFANFKTNPYFFLQYFFLQMCFTVSLLLVVHSLITIELSFNYKLSYLLYLPLTFIFGLQIPVLLHNCVHYNVKPKWLNELLGEMCGFFVLFGMAPFRISHVLHHAHSDDDELDPHPPRGKGFLQFVGSTQVNTIRVISNQYFDKFGRNKKTYSIMALQMIFYYIGLLSRLAVWFILFGPSLFVAIFLPAYVTNLLVFAHINYATHREDENGEMEIVNLNHNFYYKVVNFFGAGAYYHLNHHKYPNLYNPKSMEKEEPIIPSFLSALRRR